MKEAVWSRLGPVTGLLVFPLIIVGFSIHGYPAIGPSDAQLANWLAGVDVSKFTLGVYVEALATVLLIPFAAWLYVHLREGRRDASRPAIVMLVAGAGWVILTLPVNEAWVGLVEQARKGLDIHVAQMVVAINQAWFEMTGIMLGLMLMAAGVAIVRGGAMSRWAGWVATIVGVGMVASVPFGAASTPAQLLSFAWILAVGGYYTFRPGRTRELDPAASRPSVASTLPATR